MKLHAMVVAMISVHDKALEGFFNDLVKAFTIPFE
jgi:hypothetical protein|tara:strand:- start:1402 stop:1506 length:105 start_codon:yes stop_codon:yes gene_type:complete